MNPTAMLECRMANLAKAQETRLAMAAVKRQIREGELSIPEAIILPCVSSMLLSRLLLVQHGWGPRRVVRLFRELERVGVPVSQTRRIGDLSGLQREALRRVLR